MKTIYRQSFEKDLLRINDKATLQRIKAILISAESAQQISEIQNVKKLKGHKTAFRIRVGIYRLGFFFENNSLEFTAAKHRKDIYRSFP